MSKSLVLICALLSLAHTVNAGSCPVLEGEYICQTQSGFFDFSIAQIDKSMDYNVVLYTFITEKSVLELESQSGFSEIDVSAEDASRTEMTVEFLCNSSALEVHESGSTQNSQGDVVSSWNVTTAYYKNEKGDLTAEIKKVINGVHIITPLRVCRSKK